MFTPRRMPVAFKKMSRFFPMDPHPTAGLACSQGAMAKLRRIGRVSTTSRPGWGWWPTKSSMLRGEVLYLPACSLQIFGNSWIMVDLNHPETCSQKITASLRSFVKLTYNLYFESWMPSSLSICEIYTILNINVIQFIYIIINIPSSSNIHNQNQVILTSSVISPRCLCRWAFQVIYGCWPQTHPSSCEALK